MTVRALRQTLLLVQLSLAGIRSRLGSTLVALLGIASVVMILAATLSLGAGVRGTLTQSGREDIAVVLRAGSPSESASLLSENETRVIVASARQYLEGENAATASEVLVMVDRLLATSSTPANLPLRGIVADSLALMPDFQILSGRMFEFGRNELIVGHAATHTFSGLKVGGSLRFGTEIWDIVGEFEQRGSARESEAWGDARRIQSLFGRTGVFQSVLAGPVDVNRLADALKIDSRVNVSVRSERAFFAEQAGQLVAVIRLLAIVIAMLMGLGAVASAINAFYINVASRRREIATLRAVGYTSAPIVASVLAEGMAIGVIGGLIGGAFAFGLFDGIETSTLNWQSLSQLSFEFAITAEVLAYSIGYALILGLLGGVPPAFRAVRDPITEGLAAL